MWARTTKVNEGEVYEEKGKIKPPGQTGTRMGWFLSRMMDPRARVHHLAHQAGTQCISMEAWKRAQLGMYSSLERSAYTWELWLRTWINYFPLWVSMKI